MKCKFYKLCDFFIEDKCNENKIYNCEIYEIFDKRFYVYNFESELEYDKREREKDNKKDV